MPFPAPDYFPGSNDFERGAKTLFELAGWIRRRCNEIVAETSLDATKIYSLADLCFRFRQEADKWIQAGEVTNVLSALAREIRERAPNAPVKTEAEVNAEAKALYAGAGAFLAWATANLPQVGQPIANVTVSINRAWPNPDFIVTVPKPQAASDAVASLRALLD